MWMWKLTNLLHIAMNIAKNTVPLLSNNRLICAKKRRKKSNKHQQIIITIQVFQSKNTDVPWHMCTCLIVPTLYKCCHKVDTWLCSIHKPLFYKTIWIIIIWGISTEEMLWIACGKHTWGVMCWRSWGHRERLLIQWQQVGWGDMYTSPTTGSTRPPSHQSSSWQKNKDTHGVRRNSWKPEEKLCIITVQTMYCRFA